MQHYVFAVHAFLNVIKDRNADSFSYLIKETRTDEVLINVRDNRSEIGILSYSNSNRNVIHKLFREYDLEFHPLMACDTYVYLSKEHPLAEEKELSVEDLKIIHVFLLTRQMKESFICQRKHYPVMNLIK